MCFWNKFNLILFNKESIRSSELVIYTTQDEKTKLQVNLQDETVWLNRHQMAELLDRDIKTIGKHSNNIFKEGELGKNSVVANFATTAEDGKYISDFDSEMKKQLENNSDWLS